MMFNNEIFICNQQILSALGKGDGGLSQHAMLILYKFSLFAPLILRYQSCARMDGIIYL